MLSLVLIIVWNNPIFCQIKINGKLTDSKSKIALPYVNIGIKAKNIGTMSQVDGSFAITIPSTHISDTLTFSLIGYHEFKAPISQLNSKAEIHIQLNGKVTLLGEVQVQGQKFVEKKYGIKKTGIIHFTDGIFKKDDSFEIGQVIKLGSKPAKITSLNLHLNSTREDSATFRINFYHFDEDQNIPAGRVFDRSIVQRHPLREGWLKFDLSDYDIRLNGDVFASVEFIPENKDVEQIFYAVKLGGSSRSFFRRSSLGLWVRPPHHYCLYVTALTDKNVPDEPEDVETPPTFILESDFSKEPFSIYLKLPRGYSKNTEITYPVIFLLDGNAFFDPISTSVDQLIKKKKIKTEPILVGIGYENAYLMDSLRARDYTFPASPPPDSFGINGEGANFYKFIKTKIIPHIDSAYRTEKANRTIMGHSLGGYFVLYSLLLHSIDSSIFKNYVAASPSLSYYDSYLFKQFKNLKSNDLKDTKLYLTVGELEIKDSATHSFKSFFQMLASKNFLLIQPEVYKNLEHMGTAIPSFEDGIEFVLGK